MEREKLVEELRRVVSDLWHLDDSLLTVHRILSRLETLGLVVVPREPTKEMIRAGADADIPGGDIDGPAFRDCKVLEDDVPVIYRAMIDAALTDPPAKPGPHTKETADSGG